jgi:hypothetical protein
MSCVQVGKHPCERFWGTVIAVQAGTCSRKTKQGNDCGGNDGVDVSFAIGISRRERSICFAVPA